MIPLDWEFLISRIVPKIDSFRICLLWFMAKFSSKKPDWGMEVGPGNNKCVCSRFLITLIFGLKMMNSLL